MYMYMCRLIWMVGGYSRVGVYAAEEFLNQLRIGLLAA